VFKLSLPGGSSTESLDLNSFEVGAWVVFLLIQPCLVMQNALVGLAVDFFAPSQDEAGRLVAFFQTLALSKGHEMLQVARMLTNTRPPFDQF